MQQMGRYTREYLFGTRKIPVHVQLNRQTGIEFPHNHEYIEIVLVHEGQALHETAEGTSVIGRGKVIILHPGAWHAYRECRNFKIYNCCFGLELLHNELAWLIEEPILGPLLWGGGLNSQRGVATLKLRPGTEQRCNNLAAELSSVMNGSPAVAHAEAVARLSVFLTVLSANLLLRKGNVDNLTSSTHPAVMNCMRQIEADIAHHWTLAELARLSGVCREHLIRLFNHKINSSPMAYLDRRRSERAAHLLEKTNLPIGEIGLQVGWSSPITFSRRFKAHHGISATAYRARPVSGNKEDHTA
jgi:AraC family transcriptional regulator, L-rhamnose operon transcriptional activator RhaR